MCRLKVTRAKTCFHPLKSGRNVKRRPADYHPVGVSIPSSRVGTGGGIRHLRVQVTVSIPSSRVGTLIAQGEGGESTVFPSPQVGSEPKDRYQRSAIAPRFPSPQVGSEHFPPPPSELERLVSIPSSRVGTLILCPSRAQTGAFPSPQVGSEPPRRSPRGGRH